LLPRREAGYNLVVMAMTITVLSIFVAAAIPVWSHASRRAKEEELVFRGMQIAEGIRVFQSRYGRPPSRLEELFETSPRCIRQLWKDPMTEDGEWGLIFGQPQQPRGRNNAAGNNARGGQGNVPQANLNDLTTADFQGTGSRRQTAQGTRSLSGSQSRDTGLTGEKRQTGPIMGVHSLSDEESIRIFDGAEVYSEWVFAVEKIPTPAVNPSNGQIMRATDRWVGKPFPEGIEPQSGSGPGGDTEAEDPFGGSNSGKNPLDRGGAFGSKSRNSGSRGNSRE